MVFFTEFFAVGLGQGVAALAPSIYTAAMANPFLLVIFGLFCGVTIPPQVRTSSCFSPLLATQLTGPLRPLIAGDAVLLARVDVSVNSLCRPTSRRESLTTSSMA